MDMTVTPPDMTTPPRYGLVRIGTTSVVAGTTTIVTSAATALFVDPTQGGAGCQRTVQGECTLYTCDGTSFTAPHAGNITLGGGTQNVTLTPRSDGSYEPYGNSASTVFPPGTAIDVAAAGQAQQVPAFTGRITQPGATQFSLTMPDGSRPNILFAINKSQDYQVTWSGPTAGSKVVAELIQNPDNNRSVTLECVFDGARGNGTLPATLLSKFQNSNGTTGLGSFLVGPAVTSTVKQGAWDISMIGISGGRNGSATLQ